MTTRARHTLAVGLTAALAVGLAACGDPERPPSSPAPSPASTTASPDATSTGPVSSPATTTAGLRLPHGEGTVVADGLELPWSLLFVDGIPVFSQRNRATVSAIIDGRVVELGRVPDVVPGGEGGLLGLAVSPDVPDTLFAYTTAADDNRVVRMPLTRTGGSFTLGPPEPILTGIPKASNHNGGRIHFGPDGMLYIGTGDAATTSNSQDKNSLGGKILRITSGGKVPPDNPFGSPVWSLGHRNVQGLAWSADGSMWASEFGQNTWDELNIITPGANYGWPDVEGDGTVDGFTNPVATWATDEASPSGLLQLDGTLYLAALRGERLWVMPADPARITAERTAVLTGDTGLGRLRDVVAGPDDTIWVLTSNGNDDKIVSFQLTP